MLITSGGVGGKHKGQALWSLRLGELGAGILCVGLSEKVVKLRSLHSFMTVPESRQGLATSGGDVCVGWG